MKISKVSIRNFRCFEEVDIDFTQTHALIGENGSGKTSVLEAIQFATASGLPYLDEQDFNNKDLGNLSIEVFFDEPFLNRIPDAYDTRDIPCQSIMLNAHRRERPTAGKALSEPFVIEKYSIPLVYDNTNIPTVETGDILKVNIPESVVKTQLGYESPRKTTNNPFRFTKTRLTLQNDTINLPDIFYFDRDRENQAKIGFNSLLQKIAKDLNWRFRKDWNQTEILSKWESFYSEVINTVENPKNGRIIKPVREKLNKIAGINFSDLEMGLLDIEQPFSQTFLSRRIGTNQVDQKRFGSGISILLAYFLLETICKLSKEKIIILIDEPELHLHPQLQCSLLNEFKESEFQTIYTTQSDCFVNIADWKSITKFYNNHSVSPKESDLAEVVNGSSISTHLEEIKKWHQHQSIFFREDNQIFFANKCLLVEGPAEKYGLPVIAQKLDINLGLVTIISCNGKGKIPYYQLFCKAFGIPYYSLFDLDGRPTTDLENKRVSDWGKPTDVSTFSTNFEDLLGVSTSSHKASEVLTKIDNLSAVDINTEIVNSLKAISVWVATYPI